MLKPYNPKIASVPELSILMTRGAWGRRAGGAHCASGTGGSIRARRSRQARAGAEQGQGQAARAWLPDALKPRRRQRGPRARIANLSLCRDTDSGMLLLHDSVFRAHAR